MVVSHHFVFKMVESHHMVDVHHKVEVHHMVEIHHMVESHHNFWCNCSWNGLPASEGPDRRVEGCVQKIINGVSQKMGFHHRGNVNVQHFTICKNLIFTLSPSQTWVTPCQICMFFLDPLIKCYFCVLSSKLGPLWCLSGKCGHPCPFMRPSSIMGTF